MRLGASVSIRAGISVRAGIQLMNTRERERAPYGERSDGLGKGSFQETTMRCFPLDLLIHNNVLLVEDSRPVLIPDWANPQGLHIV